MAASMSSLNDTINSIELLVKGMTSGIKNNESAIKKLDTSTKTLESTTQKLSNEVDGMGDVVQDLESIIKDQRDDIEALRLQIKKQAWGIHSITNAEEAAKPAFQAICNELLRLANRYTLNPSNNNFREEIRAVSSIVTPSVSLRSFLFLTRQITHAEAQQIITETKDGSRQLFKNPVTPARIMSLKQGLLRKAISIAHHENPSGLPLEYRSLVEFIIGGCEQLGRRAQKKLMGDGDAYLTVVDEQLKRAERQLRYNHVLDRYDPAHDKRVQDWKFCRLIKWGGGCINGFRDLEPEYFPDPDNFRIIRGQLALVCKCEECGTLDA